MSTKGLVQLARFFVVSVFFAPAAVFFESQLLGSIELVTCSDIVLPFADCADKCERDALFLFGHDRYYIAVMGKRQGSALPVVYLWGFVIFFFSFIYHIYSDDYSRANCSQAQKESHGICFLLFLGAFRFRKR